MIVAQLSDFHVGRPGELVFGDVDSPAHLARCVRHLMRLQPLPELVVVTGDLVDAGTVEEYRHVRELLAPLTMPYCVLPGNHDVRDAMRAAFADHRYLAACGRFIQYALEGHALRLLALDTLVPGECGGELCAERLGWLDARLGEAPERPTLICMHHPPIVTGLHYMDVMGLAPESAAALAAIVERHPQVRLIVCGHIHRPIFGSLRGVPVSVCPSVACQGILDLRQEAVDVATPEPPAFQLHVWDGAQFVSHTVNCPPDAS